MKTPISGLHHVTAITSDAQQNHDFYTRTLGLRLVKKTVNFDDPSSYHLYYGNDSGAPGTILTFFVWPNATRGRLGTGETSAIALSIPRDSLSFWRERLAQLGIETKTFKSFGDEILTFRDPDNIALDLVACDDARSGWNNGAIPIEYSIRGLHSVTITAAAASHDVETLRGIMSFELLRKEGERWRVTTTQTPQHAHAGQFVDVVQSAEKRGQMGAGTIHHIAFRVDDDEAQTQWRDELTNRGFNVSPVMDRNYFHSIYFRKLGGVLFEIATDNPGFAIDETIETLGESLKLPPQYEVSRARIEAVLPALRLPSEEK